MPTLDWLNREAAFQTAAQVPTRILRPHAAGHVMGDPAGAGNLLIQGDNLEALKALLPFYRGQVKCIFIDPPYNTKSAFEHYDDNLEHSQWLSMMLPRLQILRELLSEDGSIWVTIDDNEGHYLKVRMPPSRRRPVCDGVPRSEPCRLFSRPSRTGSTFLPVRANLNTPSVKPATSARLSRMAATSTIWRRSWHHCKQPEVATST